MFAAQVESSYSRGDYDASLEASRSAGKWTRISLWIFIAWVVLILAAVVLLVGLLGYSFTGLGDLINT